MLRHGSCLRAIGSSEGSCPPEFSTLKLGCSRWKIGALVAAELSLILVMSVGLTMGLTVGTVYWQADLLQRWL
jgi:hypothetical protein